MLFSFLISSFARRWQEETLNGGRPAGSIWLHSSGNESGFSPHVSNNRALHTCSDMLTARAITIQNNLRQFHVLVVNDVCWFPSRWDPSLEDSRSSTFRDIRIKRTSRIEMTTLGDLNKEEIGKAVFNNDRS